MAANKVVNSGTVLAQQADGRYELVVWHRLTRGRLQEEKVSDLSWTEAVDCLLTMLDGLRPGWEVGDGWRQPDLEADLQWLSDLRED